MPITQNVPDGTFVAEIAGLVHPESRVHDIYRKKVLMAGELHWEYDDPKLPAPTKVSASTLEAVVAYYQSGIAGEALTEGDRLIIHVAAPDHIRILSPVVGDQLQQFEFLESKAILPSLTLNTYLGAEDFLMHLQSRFVPSENREILQKYTAKLKSGFESEIEDDGVSQQVATKSGIIRVGSPEPLPSPLMLAPYRTFPELTQPVSSFILRMKQAADGGATLALLEADGGRWRVDAIQMIGEYLRGALGENVIILA